MKNLTIDTLRQQLLDSIKARSYAEALLFAKSLRRDDIAELSTRDQSELYYLIARCLFETGEHKRAILKIKTALRLIRPIAEHSLYAREKQLLGNILARTGRVQEALECYVESFAGFKRACSYQDIFGSLVNIGLTHFAVGDVALSMKYLSESREAAVRYNSISEVQLVDRNLARSQALAGSLVEAERAVNSQLGDEVIVGLSRHYASQILGIVCAFKLQSERTRVILELAEREFHMLRMSRDVAVCLEYLGLNEYFAGNYAKAREYYDQVLAMPEPTASAVAQTLRMLTDVEIAEGNWDAAKATAARADAAINKISERIELGALWRAYGHIHTHDNDHAKAREYFEKSIDLLRQLGARYELALSHFDAGRSKAYSVEAQVEQLKAAKALFVEMEVPKRVAQVDEALGKIASLRAGNSDKTKRSLTLKSATAAPVVVAVSRSMTGIMELVDQIKNNDMTVLITGETGTGKDLLAEYIHSTGNRCGSSFKAINCAAMPESLLELELFGAKKGTFTGSTTDKPGLIESADGGTFYFDEIGDAPAAIQSKLLRVIETKTVRRLGSNEDVRVNVRFIAATNHNLQERIASREFRRDLYYRLAEVEITLPPLRDRREDVMPLISQFLKAEKVELTTEQYLQLDLRVNGYDWPGNVREVRRLVKLATATATNGELIPALESALDLLNDSGIPQTKAALIELLARNNGNIASAARELGIPRTTLVSHLKKFGLL